ncbi:hypothetical protein A2U01_0107522, partial [Trifolium medium]|nr:hypothetical protein [Trifolium medium]
YGAVRIRNIAAVSGDAVRDDK